MIPFDESGLPRLAAERVRASMLRTLATFPELSAVVHDTWIEIDDRARSFAMSRDGVLVAPVFDATSLPEADLDFIVAHELMHRALRHHARGEGEHARRFNVAADLVINEKLVGRLGREPPLGGLRDPGVAGASTERVFFGLDASKVHSDSPADVETKNRRPRRRPKRSPPQWGFPSGRTSSFESRDLGEELCVTNELLHPDLLRTFGSGGDAFRQANDVRAEPMDASEIARHLVRDSITESKLRTYDRRSRRQSAMLDDSVVLAGRKRRRTNPWRIVVDVSLSCTRLYPESFGLAADLIRRAALGPTDVLLTDGEQTEWIRGATAETLSRVRVAEARGEEYHVASLVCSNCQRPYAFRFSTRCYGSLVPAFHALEKDGARGAVVFSDGLIGAPTSTSLDDVLFVLEPLPERKFAPPFGRIVDHPVKHHRQAEP